MYIVIAIIAFGILIAIHELGHFIAAKSCGVKVNEFSIGMGPAIIKKQRGETLYAWRILPIGGYCAMEGEDEESEDERAFTSQNRFKKFIILFAGAFMNFVLGFIIIVLIFSASTAFVSNHVVSTAPGFPEGGIEAGDEIRSIDGMRIYYSQDFSTAMARAGEYVDMVVIRNGEKVKLDHYRLVPAEYTENGETQVRYGLTFNAIKATPIEKLKYSCYMSYDFVRLTWMGLSDLITGHAGIKDMSGPVGIVTMMNDVGKSSESVKAGLINVFYFCALIAINLAVMNLLPIPALDGGRIFFLVVTFIIEKIIRRKLDPKYEGYVHTAGMVLLLGLMAVILVSDVVKIIV